jgi:hypothetical protein
MPYAETHTTSPGQAVDRELLDRLVGHAQPIHAMPAGFVRAKPRR